MVPSQQIPFRFDHRPCLGGEDFLVVPGNETAVGWIDRWPAWPAPALIISGPRGCGKTHLGQVFQAKSAAVCLHAADLAAGRVPRVPEDGRVFLLDDAAEIVGGAGEEAVFHLYNALKEAGGQILLLAENPPAKWGFTLKDLASRLRAAPAIAIEPPDDALLGAVLVKLFGDRQLKVDTDVIAYMLPRMERSFVAAQGLVEALDQAALAARRNITVPLARTVMDQLDRQNSENDKD